MLNQSLDYASPAKQARRQRVAICLGAAACVVAALGTWLPLRQLLRLFSYPRGSDVSFFSLTPAIELGAATGVVIALPLTVVCGVLSWKTRQGRITTLIAAICTLFCIFSSYALCQWIVSSRGLVPFEG